MRQSYELQQEYHRRLRARDADRIGRAGLAPPAAGTDGGGRPPHTQRHPANRKHAYPGGTAGRARRDGGIQRGGHSGGTGSV